MISDLAVIQTLFYPFYEDFENSYAAFREAGSFQTKLSVAINGSHGSKLEIDFACG